MSQVIFPPSHYFVGITFNSAFYNETNSDSLTQDQANKLYISKNYNDFANGIISLNGGAKANTISSIGSVANLYEDTSLYPTNTVNLCQNNKNCNFGKYGETINLAEGATSGVNVGYLMQPATYVSVGCGSATQDTIVAIGSKNQFPATANNILIGATGNTTTMSSSTITFTAQPTITSAVPAGSDNSTKIATTAWIDTWFSYVKLNFANTWDYMQTFLTGIKTDKIDASGSGSTLLIGNNLIAGNINIGQYLGPFGSIQLGGGLGGIVSIFAGYLNVTNLATNNFGAINLGDDFNINTGNPSSTTNLAVSTNRTAPINIGNGQYSTANININSGVGSTGSVIIGTISSFLQVDATATFSALPLITASYSGIAGGDTSNTIITSYWLNTFWIPYFRGLANTWSAVQTFSALPLITASYASIAGANTSNTVITANWINATWLPYLRGLANTWAAVQTFTSSIALSAPINPNYTYPVATNRIGNRVDGTTTSGTTTVTMGGANSSTTIASIPLTDGVWIITGHQINTNIASFFQLAISTTTNVRQYGISESSMIGSTNTNETSLNVCGSISISSGATYYLVSRCSTASVVLTGVYFYAVRVA